MDSKIVSLQNPWWKDPQWQKSDPHLSIIRGQPYHYDNPLIHSLEFKPEQIHILRGPRQVGKTTLIKEWIDRLILKERARPSDILLMSCEGIESFHELQKTLIDWISAKPTQRIHVFLDEVTFVKEWQRALLSCYNLGLLRQATIVITGSNARDLKESAERLPGRRGKGRDLQLFPLMPSQYLELKCFQGYKQQDLTEIYLKVGGFPHAIRDFVTMGSISEETFRTYRNWIIGDAAHYGLSEEILKHILFRICETAGSRLTWSKLIENTMVKSHETALAYVEHLQDAHLCELLYCYDPQQHGPAIHKARKIHFIDPLLYYLSVAWKKNVAPVWEWIQLPETFNSVRGVLLESVFAIQARVQHADQNIISYFWYSTKTKQEVDLVLISPKEMSLYEIKWSGGSEFNALGKQVRILTQEDLLYCTFICEK